MAETMTTAGAKVAFRDDQSKSQASTSSPMSKCPLAVSLLRSKVVKDHPNARSFIKAVVLLIKYQETLKVARLTLRKKEEEAVSVELDASDERLFESNASSRVSDGDHAMLAGLPPSNVSTKLSEMLSKACENILAESNMDWTSLLTDVAPDPDGKYRDFSRILRQFSASFLQANKPFDALSCQCLLIRLNPFDKVPRVHCLLLASLLGLWSFARAVLEKFFPSELASAQVGETKGAGANRRGGDSNAGESFSATDLQLLLLRAWIQLHSQVEREILEARESLRWLWEKCESMKKGFSTYRIQILLRFAFADLFLLESRYCIPMSEKLCLEPSPLSFLDEALTKSSTVVRSHAEGSKQDTEPDLLEAMLVDPETNNFRNFEAASMDIFVHMNALFKVLEMYQQAGLAKHLSAVLDEGFKISRKLCFVSWLRPLLLLANRIVPEIGTQGKLKFYKAALRRVCPEAMEISSDVSFGDHQSSRSSVSQTEAAASSDSFAEAPRRSTRLRSMAENLSNNASVFRKPQERSRLSSVTSLETASPKEPADQRLLTTPQVEAIQKSLKSVRIACDYLGVEWSEEFFDGNIAWSYTPTRSLMGYGKIGLDSAAPLDPITHRWYLLNEKVKSLYATPSDQRRKQERKSDGLDELIGGLQRFRMGEEAALPAGQNVEREIGELVRDFGHLLLYPLRRQLMELYASVQLKRNEGLWNGVWGLCESMGVGLRERGRMLEMERRKIGPSDDRRPLPFINISNPEMLQSLTNQLLPSDWKIVQLNVPHKCPAALLPSDLWISSVSRDGIFVAKRSLSEDGLKCLEKIADILKENDTSTQITDKQQFWRCRKALDQRLKKLLSEIQSGWLGSLAAVLLGHWEPNKAEQRVWDKVKGKLEAMGCSPSQCRVLMDGVCGRQDFGVEKIRELVLDLEAVWQLSGKWNVSRAVEALEELRKSASPTTHSTRNTTIARERGPVLLVLSSELLDVPWECLPVYYGSNGDDDEPFPNATEALTPVVRIPSVHYLFRSLQNLKLKDVDGTSAFYVLNPTRDLVTTENLFAPFFKRQKEWAGEIGRIPPAIKIMNALEDRDIFMFCGHGHMGKLVGTSTIRNSVINAVTFLMGCNSARITSRSVNFESYGVITEYQLASCPCVVGCLWTVTDRDIDKFFLSLLLNWIQGVFCDLTEILEAAEDGSKATDAEKKAAARRAPNMTDAVKLIQEALKRPNADAVWLSEDQERSEEALCRQLFTAMTKARRSCKLQYLTGASIVGYGLPVCSRKSSQCQGRS